MALPIIRILLHWRFCLTLISKLNLAFFIFPGGGEGSKHINFRFVTSYDGSSSFRILVASVLGGLTFNFSTLEYII